MYLIVLKLCLCVLYRKVSFPNCLCSGLQPHHGKGRVFPQEFSISCSEGFTLCTDIQRKVPSKIIPFLHWTRALYIFCYRCRILKLAEGGLLTRWYNKYIPDDTCDLESRSTSATSLTLTSLSGAFLLLAAGSTLALGCLIAEIIIKRRNQCRKVKVIDQSDNDHARGSQTPKPVPHQPMRNNFLAGWSTLRQNS